VSVVVLHIVEHAFSHAVHYWRSESTVH